MKSFTPYLMISALLIAAGCTESDPGITPEMHEDFAHDHKHQHGGDHDHEHEHGDGFTGTHSHSHSHSHRHGEPLHGGRIVSIGHTHHKDGATHFHAEVMPLVDNVIRFHLLTESDAGESVDYTIEDKEIPALVSVKDKESVSEEASFTPATEGDESSEFMLSLPESLAEGEAFSVVIPKVTLGGQRQNFSFSAYREKPVVDEQETTEPDAETSNSEFSEGDVSEDVTTEASDE